MRKRDKCHLALSCKENAGINIQTFAPVSLGIYRTENCANVNWSV